MMPAQHSCGLHAWNASGPRVLQIHMVAAAGICAGVVLSEIAAVIFFPASATADALRQMRTALQKVAELNRVRCVCVAAAMLS